MRNLASFKTSLNFELPAFENVARYPNSETNLQCCDDRPMSLPSFVTLGLRIPEKALSVLPHPLKLPRKRAKSSITQPGLFDFAQIFVLSLNTGHPKCRKSSRLRGQRSRSQRDMTYGISIKNAIIHARRSCRRSNLVKIIPEPRATRNAMFKVIRSNTEISITPPRIARLRSNLVQFHQVTGDTLQMVTVTV